MKKRIFTSYIKYFFILGLFCGILVYMAEYTWGDLSKSQVDNQLISEAITAAILAHEADPTAHMGVGESIDVHRKNDILDHPIGSVKNDKFSLNDFYYDLKFADYVLWSKYKLGSTYSWNQYLDGVYFETYPSTGALYNRLYKYHINFFPTPSSFFISADVSSENDPHSSVYWSFGRFDSFLTIDRISGFKYKAGKLYASLFKASGAVSADFELVGVNIWDNSQHNLRFYYFALEEKYQWYIDGLLVYEYDNSANTFPPSVINNSGGFDFQFTYDEDYDFLVYCFNYVFSVDLTY